MMGRSSIAGWGLFAGEKVKQGQFLGEYKGEIIGNEESERRGFLYDKKGVSFLFTLNRGHLRSLRGLIVDQVVDATRAANKFRFVNHSRKDPNCFAKISFVNGVHRIGMYAKTDLYLGQELFFDYGYNSKSTKFVPLEYQARTTKAHVNTENCVASS
jgi:SET domain-containing protein